MSYLSVDDIVKAKDRKTKDHEVPEWDGTVFLAEFTAVDRDWFEAQSLKIADALARRPGEAGEEMEGFKLEAVRRCLVNPDSLTPLFGHDKIKSLSAKSGAVIDRLFDAIAELNAIDVEAEVNEAKKDLETIQS